MLDNFLIDFLLPCIINIYFLYSYYIKLFVENQLFYIIFVNNFFTLFFVTHILFTYILYSKYNIKSTIFTWSLRLDSNQYLLSYEDNALPLSYLEALVLLLGLEPRTSSLSEKCSKPTELQQDINGTELRTRTLINSFGDCHVTKLHQLCIGSACGVRTREYRLEGPVCSPLHQDAICLVILLRLELRSQVP